MVLWSRLMLVENRINAQLGIKDDIAAVTSDNKKTIARIDALDGEIIKLDSRLTTFNNRITAQNRHEEKREKENEEPPLSQDKIKQLEQFDLFHNKLTQSEQPQRFTLRKKQA
jgi:hypothetical protein